MSVGRTREHTLGGIMPFDCLAKVRYDLLRARYVYGFVIRILGAHVIKLGRWFLLRDLLLGAHGGVVD